MQCLQLFLFLMKEASPLCEKSPLSPPNHYAYALRMPSSRNGRVDELKVAPEYHRRRRLLWIFPLILISIVPVYLMSSLRAKDHRSRVSLDQSHSHRLGTTPSMTHEQVVNIGAADLKIIECPRTGGELNMSYYRNGDFFQRALADAPVEPLRVYERAREVCEGPRLDEVDPQNSSASHWKHCLPIHPNHNRLECAGATRSTLLDPRVLKPVCGSAVLDMLTIDVYRAMEEFGCQPMLTHGTALGAVRNGTHIPWTADSDIAYFLPPGASPCVQQNEFAERLRGLGYFLFKHNIWRVCIASHHPLAGRLYDIDMSIIFNWTRVCDSFGCVYVDLYGLTDHGDDGYSHEWHRSSKYFRIPSEKVLPASTISLNGLSFSTYHDIDWFLWATYGKNYHTPKREEGEDEDMDGG